MLMDVERMMDVEVVEEEKATVAAAVEEGIVTRMQNSWLTMIGQKVVVAVGVESVKMRVVHMRLINME